jgi:glycosyltransferase involved in cell wall biosynthesis
LVIVNSELTRRSVLETFGLNESVVKRVYFGATPVRTQRTKQRRGSHTVLFAGALGSDTRKGLDIALNGFRAFVDRTTAESRLLVAGAGAFEPYIPLVAKLGLESRVSFLSFVSDMDALFHEADLLLSPSRYESYGLAIQEALCAGIPALVLAGRTGIMERLGQHARPFEVPSEAPALWAAAIDRTLQRDEELEHAIERARGVLLSRSWDDFAREFVAIVEDDTRVRRTGN